MTGSAANEIFTGGAGADTIDGGGGSDIISYRDSDSALAIDLSTNSVSGGTATGDTISNIEGIYGSNYDDTLSGNSLDNVINGGAGDDIIVGGAGNDIIVGESTYDTSAVDEAHGGDGNDLIDLRNSATGYAFGGDGNDTIRSGRSSSSETYGGAGDDTITVFGGIAYGDDGVDRMTSYDDGVILVGGAGDDILKVNFNGIMLGGEGGDEYSLDQMSTSLAIIYDGGTMGTDTIFTNWTSSTSIYRERDGNDLNLSANGDTIKLVDWFAGYKTIENFVSTDHQFILNDIHWWS